MIDRHRLRSGSELRTPSLRKPQLQAMHRHTAIYGCLNHLSRTTTTTPFKYTQLRLFKMASKQETIDLTNTDDERPRKRARTQAVKNSEDTPKLSSLRASISPPRSRSVTTPAEIKKEDNAENKPTIPSGTIIPSPFSLTKIRDLPGRLNVDTVTLQSIICDPMISELWEFNYMHDLDFIMSNMDPDTRDTTKINIIHGYWRREDGLYMKEAAPRYPNINLLCAYMPEMFGTRKFGLLRSFSVSCLSIFLLNRHSLSPSLRFFP